MTISEIAKKAGVSNAAVSRYFNNGYISEEKKEAIRKVVEETGYKPSISAQQLRTRKSNLIGVIAPKMASNSIGRVVEGISGVLEQSGYQMLLTVAQNDSRKELDFFRILIEQGVDGIIYFGTILTPAHRKMLKSNDIPIVMVGQHLNGVSCVYHDDYHAIRELTRCVLDQGRKNPGYIGVTEQDRAAGEDRYKGYCDAVREAGLENAVDHYVVADFSIHSGFEKAKVLLEKNPQLDAIICATDEIAIGTFSYLKQQNISVPEQICITGHGDSELIKVNEKPIMTAHFAYEESGREGARMLLEKISNPGLPPREIKLGYYLVNQSNSIAGQE